MKKTELAAIGRAAGGLFALLGTLFLAACAANPSSESDVVIERAQARWDAVISNDLETAYTFYSPGYRSVTSLIDYGVSMRMRKVTYTSAEYLEHACEESRCTIKFNLGYRVLAPVPGLSKFDGNQTIEDTWIQTSGEWWYLPD